MRSLLVGLPHFFAFSPIATRRKQRAGLEKVQFGAHISPMPQYVDDAFVVLVHVLLASGETLRETYVVGAGTREEAETRIGTLYPLEFNIKLFASHLSVTETKALNLTAGEFRLRP